MSGKRASFSFMNGEQGEVTLPRPTRRRLMIGLGALLAVTAVTIICALMLTRQGSNAEDVPQASLLIQPKLGSLKTPFSLDDVLFTEFFAESFQGGWISDDEYMDQSEDGLFLVNVRTSEKKIIIPATDWETLGSSSATLSHSKKYVLCPYIQKRAFRYTRFSVYDIYDVENGRRISLTPTPGNGSRTYLQYAAWVPQKDAILFVYQNDLYFRPQMTSDHVIRLSETGEALSEKTGRRLVYNGIPDWVYEEEVFMQDNTVWISPDGSKVAYASFNDTEVDDMELQVFGKPGNLAFQYPVTVRIHYPKPGRSNPTVKATVVDLVETVSKGQPVSREVPPPLEFKNSEHLLVMAGWKDEDSVSLTWMNRHQNHTIITVYSWDQSQSTKALDQASPDNAWNDIEKAPLWSDDGTGYLMLLPKLEGQAGHFKHVFWVSADGLTRKPLTSGRVTVVKILHWDQLNNIVYYVAAPEEQASGRFLYSASSDVNTTTVSPAGDSTCITCSMAGTDGKPCLRGSVRMSTGGTYFALTCQARRSAPRATLHVTKTGQQLKVLKNNTALTKKLENKIIPEDITITIEMDNNFTARARLNLPPGWRQSGKKYPVLIDTYGGPGSQVVSDRWSISWAEHLVTQREVIYVTIDGRGSGYRGDRLRHAIYYRLGTGEVDDQLEVARRLPQMFDFIDANRTAIWGWSYGGFVTTMALARDQERVFKCGIAVAPVTNWIYYDTIYTERYMGLPSEDDNAAGYTASDVTAKVENFRNKQFLLVHGTADDNVHYQQSMVLARQLERADILFSQQMYPDESHGLTGTRRHHYHTMERFLERCFDLPELQFPAPAAAP